MKKNNNKNDIILTIGELAEVSGTRLTTLKYYTELRILPFNQAEKRLTRKYNKEEALIKELKEKRLTIKEIIEHFNKPTKEI
jgi:DNA-binding transcriptional MerR regulator